MSKLYQTFLRTNQAYRLIQPGDRVLCGVSGGADSIALLHMLAMNQEDLKITVCAVHVNHGLRDTAKRDEEYVRAFCDRFSVPLIVECVTVEDGASPEACARKARYEAFSKAANKFSCSKIATAHTLNDNAETVLFHLVRGSGSRGLCGIPALRENVIRPLIDCTRNDVLEYLCEFCLEHCEDETNAELAFSRNRIRNRVLPELDLVHPNACSAIHRASRLIAADTEYFDYKIDELVENASVSRDEVRYNAKEISNLHEALQTRLILRLAQITLGNSNYHLEFQHILKIRALLEHSSPSAELSFPSGLLVRRAYDEIVFYRKSNLQCNSVSLKCGGSVQFGDYIVSCDLEKPEKIHKNFMLYEIDFDTIKHGLFLRSRMVGDKIRLQKRSEKTLKKLMIEEKTEKQMRDMIPVISDGDRVVLVHGFGVDEAYCPKKDSKKIYIEVGLRENENEGNLDQ